MRYGIISDIHSNLEALETVLEFLKSQKVDGYISAGDIVGYGPNPNECVTKIRELYPLWVVVGNHDWAACGLKDITWFNEYAQKSLVWTRQTLTQNNQIYLSELPKIVHHSDFSIVHGSLRDPLSEYLLTPQQYKENLPYLKSQYTFVGHSHVPFIFVPSSTYIFKDSEQVSLAKNEKYIINAGSVGQPRDNNSRASCAIFDSSTKDFKLHRLKYDISKTQEKMYKARLPAFLIERLSWGK
ncbi:MAG: metallophosphoesterase family protein [Endomicrobiales bacterium]|nr:metallophosphoesterase family protein [Endomicrobiales bacterium]